MLFFGYEVSLFQGIYCGCYVLFSFFLYLVIFIYIVRVRLIFFIKIYLDYVVQIICNNMLLDLILFGFLMSELECLFVWQRDGN